MATYSSLAAALIKTLAWFSLTSYPLTSFECWRYLFTDGAPLPKVSPGGVASALERLSAAGVVRGQDGFWWLASAATSVEHRLAQSRIAIAKRRRALGGARLLSFVPFIQFVGLGNTLALGAARPGSDIDVLIITRRGRLFLGRLLATLAIHLCGWRRHGARIADRICLSFYLAETQLGLAPLAYADDAYLTFWLASLVPLLGGGVYASLAAANAWVTKTLPNWRGRALTPDAAQACQPVAMGRSRLGVGLERIVEVAAGGWGEAAARAFQLKLIKRHRRSRLGDGSKAVVVTGEVLKFHESDRRPELTLEFRRRLASALGSTSL